jgi:uncharacterized membrane protein (Fun14 family)
MSSEPLLCSIIPFAGSGFLGYAMGFALKKVLRWVLIIVGFLAGLFFVGVQLLQKYGPSKLIDLRIQGFCVMVVSSSKDSNLPEHRWHGAFIFYFIYCHPL